MVRVKNLHHTSDRAPKGYSSWQEFWEDKTGRPWPKTCCVNGCYRTANAGAHVKKVASSDNRWYIVPLCYVHNSPYCDDEFLVNENDLVPVNE